MLIGDVTVRCDDGTLRSSSGRHPPRRSTYIQMADYNPHRQSHNHILFHFSMSSTFFEAFALSNLYVQCFYSLLSVAFQVPFNRLYASSMGYMLPALTVITPATVARAL